MQLLTILSTLIASSAALAINPNTSNATISHELALIQPSRWTSSNTTISHNLPLKQSSHWNPLDEPPSWICTFGCELPCVNSSAPWSSCPAFALITEGDYSWHMKYIGNVPLTIEKKDFKHGIDKCLNTHHERYKFGDDAPEGHVWQAKVKVDGYERNLDCVHEAVAKGVGEEVIPAWFKPRFVPQPPEPEPDCYDFPKNMFNLQCW